MPTPEQIAWAAGIFEGEGSCRYLNYLDKHTGWRNCGIALVVRMKDEDVIRRLKAIMQVGSVKPTPEKGKSYVMWKWGVYNYADVKK